jgi:hypothetical protein
MQKTNTIRKNYPGKFQQTDKSFHDEQWQIQELLSEMLQYSNTHEEFPTKHREFLYSVNKFIAEIEMITPKQYNVLVEIYYQNNMQNIEAFND